MDMVEMIVNLVNPVNPVKFPTLLIKDYEL